MMQMHEIEVVRAEAQQTSRRPNSSRLVAGRLKVPGGWIVVVNVVETSAVGGQVITGTTSQFVSDPRHRWLDDYEVIDATEAK